jgi:hypothetical protein
VRKNNEVAFEQIATILTEAETQKIREFSTKGGFPQIILWALISALVGATVMDLHPVFGIVVFVPIVGVVGWYSWLPPYRRALLLWFSRYCVVQVGVITFIAGLLQRDGKWRYLDPSLYLLVSFAAAFILITQMKKQDLAYLAGQTEHPSVLSKKLTLYLGIFVVAGFGFMSFYRFNKFWLRDVSLIGINLVFDIIYTVVLVAIGLSITLLPFLLFNSQEFAKAQLIREYPEEFRKQAGIDSSSWYHVQ